jgi:hypothetical protein
LVKSDAFRNRGSPQLAIAVTAEITQNINSPWTGKQLESFRFRFEDYSTNELCLVFDELYVTWLWRGPFSFWCSKVR